MDKFQEGTVVFHRATGKKCVVISKTDKFVKVRTQDDTERDYFPQELETESEVTEKWREKNIPNKNIW